MDEAELVRLAEGAATAWPAFGIPLKVFVEYLRARLGEGEGGDSDDGQRQKLHATDLLLAYACLQGNEVAWKELYDQHLSRIPQFLGRIDSSPAFVDEVRQRLGAKLVREIEGPAKLALYTGQGPLGAWLRVAAIREAQNLKRRSKRSVDPNDVALAAPDENPETQLVKQGMADEFSSAFQAVLATLSSDERNVLRLHYLDGLTIEDVGKVYRVSRATAARWLASARATIIERTGAALGERLGESAPGAQSILEFVGSQFDMSLQRHFKT